MLDTKHKQIGNTCLLSNYAVCCNYFTNINTNDYFYDYFLEFIYDFVNANDFFRSIYLDNFYKDPEFSREFNNKFKRFCLDFLHYLIDDLELELFMLVYSSIFVYHFHQRTYTGYIPYDVSQENNLEGYMFIKLLHENINQISYVDSRNTVRLNYFIKNDDGKFKTNDLNIVVGEELIEHMRNNEVLINGFNEMHSFTIYCNSDDQLFYRHNTNDPDNDIQLDESCINSYNPILIYSRI